MAKKVTIGEDPEDRKVTEDGVTQAEPDMGADSPSTVIERKAASKVTGRQGRAAMNMWLSGAGFDEIAEQFDYATPVIARVVVEEAMAKAHPPEAMAAMFEKTHARYEKLIRGVMPKAEPRIPQIDPDTGRTVKDADGRVVMVDNDEHIAYVRLAADLVQRLAKLHGVEAPVQVQVTPSMQEFNELVSTVVAQARKDEIEEADIFADEDEIEAEEVP